MFKPVYHDLNVYTKSRQPLTNLRRVWMWELTPSPPSLQVSMFCGQKEGVIHDRVLDHT